LQRGERRLLPCTARNLPPTTRSQFNVVDIGSKRNCAKRQCIPQIRRNIIPSGNGSSDLKSVRCENVAYFAIGVFNESDAGRAVGVILNADPPRYDAVLVPFKIDFAIFLLVASANMPRRQPTTVVAAAASFFRLNESLFRTPFRNLIEHG